MKNDTQQIIEDTQKLCREGWEIRIRAIRAVEDSKAISDQIWENIRASRKKLKKLKQNLERNKQLSLLMLLLPYFLAN